MKNRRFERLRRKARQYHRNHSGGQFEGGILVRHDYGEIAPDGLSWWDDVQFVLGGIRIAVAWRHPRHVYQDLIGEAAQLATSHLYEKIEGGLFSGAEKKYKKLGRSRKKIVSYTTTHRPGESAWYEALRCEEARLSREAEFSVAPSIKVEQLAWCRFVTIVAPIEVRSITELHPLANLVRRILLCETTLEREFPGYVYDQAQWLAEGLATSDPGLLSHRIAGT
ncbi:MAG: hypothetical protein AB7V26_03435 [Lysobacterales bacterium]